jgi:hypothetical protein
MRKFKPSPAMVVALLALVIAIGGTATAATYVITSSQQIKDGAVTGADVKNSSLTGADVKNRSLSKNDFAGSLPAGATGPQGPKGDTGAKGEQGIQGVKGDQGDPGPLIDVLPSGRTLTGVYAFGGPASATGNVTHTSITYAVSMPARLTPHYITMGGTPPAGCTGGTAALPTAAAGHLCVFERQSSSAQSQAIFDPQANTLGETSIRGFGLEVRASENASFFGVRGTWAATAP